MISAWRDREVRNAPLQVNFLTIRVTFPPVDRLWEYEWHVEPSVRRRDAAGDPRSVDPSDSRPWSRTRTHDCPRDRTSIGRGATSRARIALSGPTPAGRSRVGCIISGDFGKQSKGEVLPPYSGRPEATRGENGSLGEVG